MSSRNRSRSRSRSYSRSRSRSYSYDSYSDQSRSRSQSVAGDEDEVLPIVEYEEEILRNIREHQVVIITGETGSGKSTQIPQMLFKNGFLKKGALAVSQPRRVAATNLARRVSEEMKCTLGEEVGYTIRFEATTKPSTKINYITDGCLVRECISDPTLSKYDVVMLDEAHDRSIHTDILFGLCKTILAKRPEFRLIVTSATLDVAQFKEFYDHAVTMEIPGRIYPVAIFHSKEAAPSSQNEAIDKSIDLVKKLHRKDPGHILVFLPGQYEIEKACSMLEKWYEDERRHSPNLNPMRILPLYANLPAEQQVRVFQSVPADTRKVVIATNIAETSVTIPGIRFVIDPGFTREKRYDAHSGIDSLETVSISQVSAQQRAGRAGRTGSGKCFRLYSSDHYHQFMEKTLPEIQRTSLLSTVLYLKVLGIDDVLAFAYLDPPHPEALSIALRQLYVLGALDGEGKVTRLGHQISRLPVDPPLGKMLSIACEQGCAKEAVIISSMLSVERVFYSLTSEQLRSKRGQALLRRQKRFVSDLGDHFTFLNVYMKFLSHDQSRTWCEDNGVHYRSLRTAVSICKQLEDTIAHSDLPHNRTAEDPITALQISITEGCVLTLARRCANNCYRTLVDLHDGGGTRIGELHPSSSLVMSDHYPHYIVFQELIASNRSYYRNCCIVPEDSVVSQLSRIKSLKEVKLSGGSELVFYTSKGKKIETVEEVQATEIKPIASNVKAGEIEAARLRYLQRKGLL